MALAITVNGAGTFTASMEEGPVSFTASLGAVPGPAGVVAATAPIVYTSGTQTVSMDTSYFLRSPAVAGTDGQIVSWDAATSRPLWIDNQARTLFATVRNETGSTLSKGTVVYINGASGNKATVTKAQADSDATSAQTFAVIYADISNNQNGTAIVAGELAGLNTSSYADGAALYLSPTTAGAFTTTKPSAPNHLVYVATVTRSHANQGSIEVRIQNGYELEELHNVAISSVSDKDLLVYESATSLWKNKSFATLDLLTGTSAASTYLAKASNLSDLSSASTARTNLGLGTMATETAADYLSKAGNLSGLASASTARSNLGLGTMAVETAADYAKLASPALTGTPTAPTAAAATNTTQIATTAFVQQEVPSASTSTAGKVQLATDAQSLLGTNNTAAVTPFETRIAQVSGELWIPGNTNLSSASSGTGSSGGGAGSTLYATLQAPNSATTGYATRGFSVYYPTNSANQTTNFSVKGGFTCKVFSTQWATVRTDVKFRIIYGRQSATIPVPGTLAARGYGIEFNYNTSKASIIAHDGTTLTTTAMTWTPSNSRSYELTCLYDGAGTVSFYVDGALIGSSTGGPTGTQSTNITWWQVEIENTSASSPANTNITIMNPKVYLQNG